MTVRIGVVGLGRIGELHARNLAASGLVSSMVVYDADDVRTRFVAKSLAASPVADVEKLLSSGIDGLVIATPTPTHAGLVNEALRRGVAVFCEKPLGASIEVGFALATLAKERGVALQVGLQRRCDPQLCRVREELAAEADGRLLGLRIVSTSWQPPKRAYLAASGGFFRDKLLHDIDVVRWITGRTIDAVAVTGSGAATGWIGEAGDVDTASVSLLLGGVVVAQIWAARLSPTRFEFRLEAVSERRTVVAGRWPDGQPPDMARRESPFPTFLSRFKEAYAGELASFCRLVDGTGENVCTAADAMASEVATAAAERAWREGRVVRAGVTEATKGESRRWSEASVNRLL